MLKPTEQVVAQKKHHYAYQQDVHTWAFSLHFRSGVFQCFEYAYLFCPYPKDRIPFHSLLITKMLCNATTMPSLGDNEKCSTNMLFWYNLRFYYVLYNIRNELASEIIYDRLTMLVLQREKCIYYVYLFDLFCFRFRQSISCHLRRKSKGFWCPCPLQLSQTNSNHQRE